MGRRGYSDIFDICIVATRFMHSLGRFFGGFNSLNFDIFFSKAYEDFFCRYFGGSPLNWTIFGVISIVNYFQGLFRTNEQNGNSFWSIISSISLDSLIFFVV